MRIVSLTLIILWLLLGMGQGVARAEQDLPPSVEPGMIEEKIRQEEERRRQKEEQKEEPITPLEEEKEPEEKPLEAEVKILIRKIKVTDNTVISNEELREIVSSYENKSYSLSELRGIAKKLTDLYRKEGYFTSRAFVPPQTIEDGVVELKILEGKMGNIVVEGAKYFKTDLIAEKIHTKSGEVLNFHDLETDLRRANRHPDVMVQGLLRAGTKPGTTDLVLKVKDRSPHHVRASLDNQGTRLIGRIRYGAGYSHTNVWGRQNQFHGRVIAGSSLLGMGVGYQMPLNRYQTSMDAGYSYTEVRPQKDFKVLNVKGMATTYSVALQQPIYAPHGFQVELGLGYDHRNVRTQLNRTQFSRDELRIARSSVDVRLRDGWGTTVISHIFRIGIPRLFDGAHVQQTNFSRPGAGGRFFKWVGSLMRVQPLPLNISAVLSAQAQFTAHKLPTSEFFYLGGANTVRGYPESDYLGEEGIRGTAELLIPAFFIPSDFQVPFSSGALKDRMQLVTFLDVAEGWMKKEATGFDDNAYMMGLGGGFRAQFFKNLYTRLEGAWALGNDSTDKRQFAIHFLVSSDIL